jgi:ABC-type phosphate transport system substrate-binding protein
MRGRLLVVAVALVAAAVVATAGAASVISETTWGGPRSEVTNGAAVASDGSSYLTGFTNSFVQSGQQAFLTKFAADGSLSWERTFQGPEQFTTDEGKGVAVAADGSVYVTGQTVGAEVTCSCSSSRRTARSSGSDAGTAAARRPGRR